MRSLVSEEGLHSTHLVKKNNKKKKLNKTSCMIGCYLLETNQNNVTGHIKNWRLSALPVKLLSQNKLRLEFITGRDDASAT
jgi:hypothetical protein